MERLLGLVIALAATSALVWAFIYNVVFQGFSFEDTWMIANWPAPIGYFLVFLIVCGSTVVFIGDE